MRPEGSIANICGVTIEIGRTVKGNKGEDKGKGVIQVRFTNLKAKSRIRDLGPENIDKLISIRDYYKNEEK